MRRSLQNKMICNVHYILSRFWQHLVQTGKLSFYKIDSQIKKEIIAEISATTTKTVDQAVRDSLKRALPQEFLDKTTDETIKRIKSSTIPEFKSKSNKIRYEPNNNILEKIDDAMNAIEKGHIERCQERLKEGKALILKQQKLIRKGDREEDGWEVVKLYLSDDLTSDSEDEKQLNKARRETASNKKKREAGKLKDRKKQFRNGSFSEETLKPSVNRTKDKVPTGIISEHQKYFISAKKKDISSMTVPFKEQDNFDFIYKRD